VVTLVRHPEATNESAEPVRERLPVVLTPDPSPAMGGAGVAVQAL
jgi:hypothetical protein